MARQKLVDFLLTVDKQHVGNLVDILTDFGKGRSALNATVKNVLIAAKESNRSFTKKEIDLLLIEFQKYGGNSIINLVRNNDRLVSYHEILNDVFKQIVGDIKDTDHFTDEEKEQKIVQILFSNKWKSMPFSDRYEKSKDMMSIILKNVKGGATNNGAVNLVSKIFFFTPSVILDSFSEALRITIPFVAQIAWLKMMEKDQQDNHEIRSVKISSNQDLIVADTDNKDAILSLTEYAEPPEIKNEFNPSNISLFNQLFSNVPALATKLETARSHIVSINIDPSKLTPAKDGNGLRGIVHGYNKDGHFGITENVRIFEADTLGQIVNSGVILNLASTVVAQKHLADINEKLKEIQKGIDDIKDFLSNERHSKIYAALNLIKHISQHMAKYRQETTNFDKFKGRLEQGLYDNLAIKLHLETDLDSIYKQINNIKFDSFIGWNNNDIQALIKKMKTWQEIYESYQLCCNVVMMMYAILYTNGSSEEDKESYSDELKSFVNDTDKFISGKVNQIQKCLQQAHNNAKGFTNFKSSELAYEALFNGCIEGFKLHQQELNKQLSQIATSVTTLTPVKATLLIENGEIQGGQFLLD